MKLEPKFIFILIVVLVWGFIYAEIEDAKKKDIEKDESSYPVVNGMNDAVKVAVKGDLSIYYFNVGQADCILLVNDDKYMLIDAGNNLDGKNIVNYLKKLGVTKLDYLVATHAHEDHIGGMDDVINAFDIGTFYMPDVITTTKTFEDLIVALEDNNVKVETPNIGDIFLFGGCKFEVLHLDDDESDLNNTSIVLRGLYGNTSFLFMGDATSEVEKEILNSNIDSDVLKVGHHGSRYSSSINFLKKVTPKYSIISAGKDNSYNHPHSVTFTKLEDVDSKVFRTDNDGTIFVTSDGTDIEVEKMALSLNG